jgi:Tfp pilus assembly protein PilZ
MDHKLFGKEPQFVFGNIEKFVTAFQTPQWPSGVFYGTYRRFRIGRAVTIKVKLGRAKPVLLTGTVAYLRRSQRQLCIGGGVGIDLHASARPKVEYLLHLARQAHAVGQDLIDRRQHHRLPLDFPVCWLRPWSPTALAKLGDIGFGGAFVRDVDCLPAGGDVFLKIIVPGTELPTIVSARVAWVRYDGPPGFGVKWRARDTGGLRLIQEIVTRIKMPPRSE